jgi:hypothetical protein
MLELLCQLFACIVMGRTDFGVSFHPEVCDAFDDRGSRIVDAVKHRLRRT